MPDLSTVVCLCNGISAKSTGQLYKGRMVATRLATRYKPRVVQHSCVKWRHNRRNCLVQAVVIYPQSNQRTRGGTSVDVPVSNTPLFPRLSQSSAHVVSQVPLGGFASLQGMRGIQKFNIHKAFGGSHLLPAAHTWCVLLAVEAELMVPVASSAAHEYFVVRPVFCYHICKLSLLKKIALRVRRERTPRHDAVVAKYKRQKRTPVRRGGGGSRLCVRFSHGAATGFLVRSASFAGNGKANKNLLALPTTTTNGILLPLSDFIPMSWISISSTHPGRKNLAGSTATRCLVELFRRRCNSCILVVDR